MLWMNVGGCDTLPLAYVIWLDTIVLIVQTHHPYAHSYARGTGVAATLAGDDGQSFTSLYDFLYIAKLNVTVSYEITP